MRLRSLVAWIVIVGLAAGVCVALSSPANGVPPSGYMAVPSDLFRPVVVQTWPVSAYSGPRQDRDATPAPTATPRPTVRPRSFSGGTVLATWFATGRDGMFAAAGPALRVGDWRGRVVTVCYQARCIRVTINDWCQCSFRQPDERAIDLSDEAFAALAPLSRGVISVSLSW